MNVKFYTKLVLLMAIKQVLYAVLVGLCKVALTFKPR